MMDVRYKTYPIGSRGVWQRGTVLGLLKSIPALGLRLIVRPELPPIGELNALLMTGGQYDGMSGEYTWKPFSLTKDEYDEIFMDLATEPPHKQITFGMFPELAGLTDEDFKSAEYHGDPDDDLS